MGVAMTSNWFSPFLWQYRYLLHTTSRYKLIGTNDTMIITVNVVLSRHLGSIMGWTRSDSSHCKTWKAPHPSMSLYTSSTHTWYMLSREWALRATWRSYELHEWATWLTVIVLPRHAGSPYYGPDQITILRYKLILHFRIMKSSSSLYEPMYIVHTYIISRVWALRAAWMGYDIIPHGWAIHGTYMQ